MRKTKIQHAIALALSGISLFSLALSSSSVHAQETEDSSIQTSEYILKDVLMFSAVRIGVNA